MEGFQNIDIEVPEGLNPELVALGWLVGVWEGSGNGADHELRPHMWARLAKQ